MVVPVGGFTERLHDANSLPWLTVDTVAMSDGTRIGRGGSLVTVGAVAMSDGICRLAIPHCWFEANLFRGVHRRVIQTVKKTKNQTVHVQFA